MKFTVQILKGDGSTETLARGVSAEVAESMERHPSLKGCRVVVVPTFAELPA